MTPKEERLLKRLNEKLQEAVQRGNFLRQMELSVQIHQLEEREKKLQHTTLLQALKDYTPEKRREMTVKMVTAVSIADILLSATLDIEDAFRELGIADIPLLRDVKEISRSCRRVVATIGKAHNDFFDEHYISVTDEIEEKVVPMLKNYIVNEMNKAGQVVK